MMTLSCQERLLPGQTLAERWENARRTGWDGIELHGFANYSLRERLAELRAAVASGVVFSSVCVSMRSFIGDFDAERRREAIDNIKAQLSVIAELGGTGVVNPAAHGQFSFKLPPFEPPPRSEADDFSVLVDALGELGAHASSEGARVFFEPLNRYEDHMVNRLDQGAMIVTAVGSDAVKLVADTYHMNIEEDDPPAAVRAAGPLIGHVQLGDTGRWQPGTGHFDFAGTISALHDVGYDGWLALECNLRGEPLEALTEGSAVMAPLLVRAAE
jgi:sugar phosphate isomerase/epimerase